MLQNVFDSMRPEIRRRAGEELFDRTLGRFVSNPTAICVCSQPDADEIATAAESFGLALDGTRVVVTGQPEIDTIQTLYVGGTPHFFGLERALRPSPGLTEVGSQIRRRSWR